VAKRHTVQPRELEFLVAQIAKATYDVERGRIDESIGQLPTPPVGRCPKYLFLHDEGYCGRKLYEGSEYCYWHTESKDKYLPESIRKYFGERLTLGQALVKEIADGRSLQGAYLVEAPLGGNMLCPGCDLKGVKFPRANLSGAHLSYSNLEGVDFSFANLESARLSACRIGGARFIGARLFGTKFRDNVFSGVIGLTMENFRTLKWGWVPMYRIFEEYPGQSETIYRKLATYFSVEGLLDDASWAAYRACLMRHRLLSKKLSPIQLGMTNILDSAIYEKPLKIGHFPSRKYGLPWIIGVLAWCRSMLLRIVMGYGEKPLRVVANAFCVILAYSAAYYFHGQITGRSFVDSLYFSIVTFTTLGYGDIAPHGYMRLVAASEALVGIFLSGLFIFCLGRRSVGRA
jgi:uncharacterized protein YjbI with pentapeptide repeats